jgi:phosphoribosylaminoimidazole (AIR) synthetase
MFKTFNMGWGFAIIIDKKDRDEALDALERTRFEAEQIGRVTGSPGIKVFYRMRRILLK